MSDYSEEEKYCYEMLERLRRSYEECAKQYIDRLVAIKSMSIKPSIAYSAEYMQAQYDEAPRIDLGA